MPREVLGEGVVLQDRAEFGDGTGYLQQAGNYAGDYVELE